jgi:ABC-type polysaccharide/polyol phosphate transport system ATPase subunit
MNNEPQIILKHIAKKYKLYATKSDRVVEALVPFSGHRHREFYALKDINLVVNKGDILGILGRNGSGKSTLLKLIAGITTPTKGSLHVNGRIVPLLELGAGFHPDLTGRENIYFYSMLLGYSKQVIHELVAQVIDFAEIGEFIDQPIRIYSSGMKSRLAFSVSVNIDPDILIVDEVLSVGDEYFKAKSIERMQKLFRSGKTILFVSHSAKDLVALCNRAVMLHEGNIVREGVPESVLDYYQRYFKKA